MWTEKKREFLELESEKKSKEKWEAGNRYKWNYLGHKDLQWFVHMLYDTFFNKNLFNIFSECNRLMKIMFSASLWFVFGSDRFVLWNFLEKTFNFKHSHKIQFLMQIYKNKNVQQEVYFLRPFPPPHRICGSLQMNQAASGIRTLKLVYNMRKKLNVVICPMLLKR